MKKMVFPLSNGVGLYEKDKLCVSIIDSNGENRVGGENLKTYQGFLKTPFLRGIYYLIFGIYLYLKTFFLALKLDSTFDKAKNKEYQVAKKINFASGYIVLISALIFSFIAGFLLLSVLPSYLFRLCFDEFSNYYFRSFIIALIRVSIVYLVMIGLKFAPFMNSFYGFNGIGNVYLSGRKISFRSRTMPFNFLNFITFAMLLSIFVVSLVAINIVWYIDFLVNVISIALCIMLSFEFLKFISESKIQWLQDFSLPSSWLVCNKPNTTNQEVFQVAKIELNSYDNFDEMDKEKISLSSVYSEMQTKLTTSERFEKSDMEWIVATVLTKNRLEAKLVRTISKKEYNMIMRACERRSKGEPLSSIFGFVDFYGLRFDVNKKVLTPRSETESLVEMAVNKIKEKSLQSALDLCCGSGAIGVCLAKYTDCDVTCVDISKPALAVAKNNAEKNDVKIDFLQSDLFKELKKNKKYDIIVSNPPYIKTEDIEKLDIEVKNFDPRLSLDGGEDGYDFYRIIANESGKHLTKNGWLFVEVGKGQAKQVALMMEENNFKDVQIEKDLYNVERIVYGRIGK